MYNNAVLYKYSNQEKPLTIYDIKYGNIINYFAVSMLEHIYYKYTILNIRNH